MRIVRFISTAIAAATLSSTGVHAAEPAPIVSSIMEDSVSVVMLPDELMQRLFRPAETEVEKEEGTPRSRTHSAGFRVQVFSDNNARTAKNEARNKEQTVAARFPQYRTYKKYSAPYWRLRVGDFRTQREAEAAAAELRRAFPSFGKEIRVVRDRINLTD